MDGINSDKVNINLGEGGGGGAGSMAAVIAALGNRNQGDNTAALIAALGNRNDSASNIGPLLAMLGNRRDDDHGMSGILPIVVLLALLGKRGLGGGDDCDNNHDGNHGRTALLQTLLEGQSDLRAQVPTTALELQNSLGKSIAALALADQQGFANTKDAVQALALFQTGQLNNINQNVSDQGCRTRDAVQLGNTTILQAIADNKYEALKNELFELRTKGHARETELTISQTVSQNQAQAQQQQQQQRFEDERFSRLFGIVANIGNQVQRSRADNDVVNFGTMAASGNQASTNTQVR